MAGCVSSAGAASAKSYDIPAGPIGVVAASLGAQAGVTITVPDPELARRPSPGVKGDFSLQDALRRALRGTGAQVLFYDRSTVRIVEKPVKPKQSTRSVEPPASPLEAMVTPADIIVTASKQNVLLDDYPGSAKLIAFDLAQQARNPGGGTEMVLETLPTLSSTNLGRGRNKIYVRGIADSSFNGPTQSTVGQYLGDVRLNYSAPDPDLSLYDMQRVEVLAGPQGTLYGAGALGGVVRLIPNAPETDEVSATASTGLSSTRFGGLGNDAAMMVNLPFAGGGMAVRLVAYGKWDAGYIDDPSRGLRDINRSKVLGQRLDWRTEDVAGWTIDVGGVYQHITNFDGQYVLRGNPPLVRANAMAQPFRNEYHLAYLTARRSIGSAELVSASAVVKHDLTSVFDATGGDGTSTPRRFEEQNDITFYSHETRVSGGNGRNPWVAGIAGIYSVNGLTRTLGSPSAPERLVGVRNRQFEVASFGQTSIAIKDALKMTLGARFSVSRSAGQLLEETIDHSGLSKTRFSSVLTAALDWKITNRLSVYANYQEGIRAGGFALAPNGDDTPVRQEFRNDELGQVEIGVRWKKMDSDGVSLRAAIFGAEWDDIQADLVDTAGLPYTANIGNGRIMGLDGEIRWRVSPALSLSASGFFNGSFLYDTPPEFASETRSSLPNIAENGARIGAEWHLDLAQDVSMTGDASIRYVGKSDLGAGPLLNISQGHYIVASFGTRLGFKHFGLSFDVSNIGDARGNTFAFGNPFGVQLRNQVTPLRPRTIRLGLDVRF